MQEQCKKGHILAEVGVDRTRDFWECKECRRKRQRKDKFKRMMDPQEIPNLRAVRRELGLSGLELSKRSGVAKSHIFNIERGERKCSTSTRDKLLSAIVMRQREVKAQYARRRA